VLETAVACTVYGCGKPVETYRTKVCGMLQIKVERYAVVSLPLINTMFSLYVRKVMALLCTSEYIDKGAKLTWYKVSGTAVPCPLFLTCHKTAHLKAT